MMKDDNKLRVNELAHHMKMRTGNINTVFNTFRNLAVPNRLIEVCIWALFIHTIFKVTQLVVRKKIWRFFATITRPGIALDRRVGCSSSSTPTDRHSKQSKITAI